MVDVEKGIPVDVENNDPRKHEKESSVLADIGKGNSSISIDVEKYKKKPSILVDVEKGDSSTSIDVENNDPKD